ncbi:MULTISPECIES: TetR/AcrR family transcriptional regulator [Rhodococcus]|uniref:TetR/AcrR family transcriptional regulator n=1 Tax=Rhodococcus parequi TaxID=3137122 RepID=A0ABW9FCR4_9NOCA
MTVSKQNRQGNATRTRIVRTAERLFAADGVDAVSVRAVNAAAGLGPSSVNYHFGTKDDLLAAVLLDMGAAVRDRIGANVDALAEDPEPAGVEALVRAVTDPYRDLLLRHRVRGMRWLKIVTQIAPQGHVALDVTEQHLRDRLLVQVRRTFPDTDAARLEARWAVALMGFLQALSRADEWGPDDPGSADRRLIAFYEDQVVYLIGGVGLLLG